MAKLKTSRFNVLREINGKYYVSNTFSGTLIELEQDIYQSLVDGLVLDDREDVVETLLKEGVYVPVDLDEIALLRAGYSSFRHSKQMAQIVICPTLECNFCCPYCFETRRVGHMDDATKTALLQYVEQKLRSGIQKIGVDWFGGEPLLYPDIVRELSLGIKDLCLKHQAGIGFTVTTNGYLISEEIIGMLSLIGVDEVKITLDGDQETHDARRKLMNGERTFEKIINNVAALSNAGIRVKIRVNIDRSNIGAYSAVRQLICKYKNVTCYPAIVTAEATQCAAQRCNCYSHDEYSDFYQNMYNIDKVFGDFDSLFSRGICSCMAEHEASCVVDSDGWLYKCVNDIGHRERAIGTLHSPDHIVSQVAARYLGRDPFSEEPCANCVYLPLCYGGCKSEYDQKGTHACPSVKALFTKMLEEQVAE